MKTIAMTTTAMRRLLSLLLLIQLFAFTASAQTVKYYDERIDPVEQMDKAVVQAKDEGKYVVCQLGGNWCKWCRWFAKFITDDAEISQTIADNFVYIHVNYASDKDERSRIVNQRLANASRFGFPVLVVLDEEGKVIHIQQSDYLEEGEGYNRERVLKFFQKWTPQAVRTVVR